MLVEIPRHADRYVRRLRDQGAVHTSDEQH